MQNLKTKKMDAESYRESPDFVMQAQTPIEDIEPGIKPVSYTHLTLPTIYSV